MSLRWAILGTGTISENFVRGLATVPGARVTVIASRDMARAQAFASRFRVPEAVGGYDASAIGAHADIAYVATPTALHSAHAQACLEAGLHVLVEKPFAASVAEAEDVITLARSRRLFAMEGLWTRFLPAARALRESMESIGGPLLIEGGFAIANAPRPERPIFRPDLAGGAMRHYGIYPLALGQMLAGRAAELTAIGRRAETGVDATMALTVRYESGAVGQYFASLEVTADQAFQALGPQGRVALTGPLYRPAGLRIVKTTPRVPRNEAGGGLKAKLRHSGAGERLVQMLQHRSSPAGRARALPFPGSGYGLEAAEAQRCIAEGLTESPVMPLDDTLELARLIDSALAQLGAAP
jgi:predicted dehydrogenase